MLVVQKLLKPKLSFTCEFSRITKHRLVTIKLIYWTFRNFCFWWETMLASLLTNHLQGVVKTTRNRGNECATEKLRYNSKSPHTPRSTWLISQNVIIDANIFYSKLLKIGGWSFFCSYLILFLQTHAKSKPYSNIILLKNCMLKNQFLKAFS